MRRLALLAAATLLPAACGDGGTGSTPNPTPGVSALNPSSLVQGSESFTLTVTGSDFVAASTVRWNGVDRPTKYVSATQVTAAITAADVAQPGSYQVSVFNPAPGGGVSNAMPVEVRVRQNPVPAITSLAPASVVAGTGGTLTVRGTGFTASSRVWLGSTALATTFVSETELRAVVEPAHVPTPGTAGIVVVNPQPGGGVSAGAALEVHNPVPTLVSLSPAESTAGQDSLVLRVTGTGFTTSSVIHVSGGSRATRRLSATELATTLSAVDVSGPGTHQITVVNPAPGGGASGALPLTLTTPAPVITTLQAHGASAGRPGFPLMVHGSGFLRTSVVRWNGADRTTRYVSGSRLEITVSSADVASPGAASLTVHTPGGGTSAAAQLTIRAVPASTTSGLLTVALPASAVVWDARSGRLYASIPSGASQHANEVVAINPETGAITGSVLAGSNPGALALSDDGSALWVALDGSGEVRRLELPGLTPGLAFSLGGSRVEEMHVMPGRPGTLAIALRNTCCSPRHEGVALYDDGVRRTRATQGHTGSNTIAFGDSASVLYGYNNETTEYGFRTISVAADGLREVRVTGNVIGSFYTRIAFAAGRVYGTNGAVADAARHVRVGTFSGGGWAVLPLPDLGRVAFVGDGGVVTVHDMNTFQQLGQVTVGGGSEHPALSRMRLVRWGTDGLAFRDGTSIRIFRTPLAGP